MYVGSPNLNAFAPLSKMVIRNTYKKEDITVLYNPESYTWSRKVHYSSAKGMSQDGESQQYAGGGAEMLHFDLFFDSYSSGSEAGSLTDSAKLNANRVLPSPAKTDVRKWTDKIFQLMSPVSADGETHAPPVLQIKWGSLQFVGVLVHCDQRFTKFVETGVPVRAVLSVTFTKYQKPSELAKLNVLNSPDTSKFLTLREGDSMWAISYKAYGDAREWRRIAKDNNIANPRLLESGRMLRIPAILRD